MSISPECKMAADARSIGAVIRDKSGNFLVQYRLKEPVGLALPAGHIDEGETPEECLRREVFEETGLKVKTYKLVYQKILPNACGKGHKNHEWWVYEAETDGEPKLTEPDKHKFLKFMPVEDMRQYVERGEVDPAWFSYILPELKIV